ncbi:MAG: RNA polymerase [Bacteroidetes bacterium OLB12]|nr:MAG: RNA polymerase [Bacteroidetes bacterium OLB12]
MTERFILSDQELIKGCVKGERASQEALYARYCRKMMVICQRYAKSTLEAEDILQEGFIKVFAAIKTFRGDAQLTTWITRIMINTALNHQRQKLYLLPMVDVANTNLHQTEDVSLADFNLSELIAMIQSLPDGARVVFNLFAIEGYNHKEIAAMLDISEGTSKSQYSRAKALLKLKLENVSVYGRLGEAKI